MSFDKAKVERALAKFKAARDQLFIELNEEWHEDGEVITGRSDVNILANAFARAGSAAEDFVYSILRPDEREGVAQHAVDTLNEAAGLIQERGVEFRAPGVGEYSA